MASILTEVEPPGSSGFEKRKRNLLVVSILLAAGIWVGAHFDPWKEISVFFYKFSLTRPERLTHVVWVIWLYFLIRYIGLQQNPVSRQTFLTDFFKGSLQYAHEKLWRPEAKKRGIEFDGKSEIIYIRTTFRGDHAYIKARPNDGKTPWGDPISLSISTAATWRARIKVVGQTIFFIVFTSECYLPYGVAFLPIAAMLTT